MAPDEHNHVYDLIKDGLAHFTKGNYESAIEFWERALDQDPNHEQIRFYLKVAYNRIGRPMPGKALKGGANPESTSLPAVMPELVNMVIPPQKTENSVERVSVSSSELETIPQQVIPPSPSSLLLPPAAVLERSEQLPSPSNMPPPSPPPRPLQLSPQFAPPPQRDMISLSASQNARATASGKNSTTTVRPPTPLEPRPLAPKAAIPLQPKPTRPVKKTGPATMVSRAPALNLVLAIATVVYLAVLTYVIWQIATAVKTRIQLQESITKAYYSYIEGNLEEAAGMFSVLALEKPESSIYMKNAFGIDIQLHRYEQVVSAMPRFQAKYGDDFIAEYFLYQAYNALQNKPNAIAAIAKAMQLNSRESAIRIAYALEQILQAPLASAQVENARQIIYNILDENPDFTQGYMVLAESYQLTFQFDQAIAWVQRALAVAPAVVENHLKLAEMYESDGDLDNAVAATEQAVLHEPTSPDLHMQMARLYRRQKQPAKALNEYDRVLFFNDRSVEAYLEKAQVYLESNHNSEAERILTFGLRQLPNGQILHLELGKLLYRTQRYKSAIEHFEAAGGLLKNNFEMLNAIAECCLETKQTKRAIDYYEQSLKVAPDQPKIKGILARFK